MDGNLLALGLVWYAVFLLSTTCHEAAHAQAAMWGGDLTAFYGGQVSLDPRPHIRREPIGMVLAPIITYLTGGWMIGWASAPYNPYWADRHPRRAAWMSLAGPAANFILALLALLGLHIGIGVGAFRFTDNPNFTNIVQAATPGLASGLATFLSLMFSLNVILGAFNLLPLPPLDGFGALGLFVSEYAVQNLRKLERGMCGFSYLGLLMAWRLFDSLFDPIYALCLFAVHIGHA